MPIYYIGTTITILTCLIKTLICITYDLESIKASCENEHDSDIKASIKIHHQSCEELESLPDLSPRLFTYTLYFCIVCISIQSLFSLKIFCIKLTESGDIVSSIFIALMFQRMFTSMPILGMFIWQFIKYQELTRLHMSEQQIELIDIDKRVSLVTRITIYLGLVVCILAVEAFCTSIAFCVSEIQNRIRVK